LHLRPLVQTELGRSHPVLCCLIGRLKAWHQLGFSFLLWRGNWIRVLLRTDERHLLLV
jgi:hypothetical protein